MTKQEFAQTVKAKYPEYKNTPDDVLADAVLKKYPEYQKHVTDAPKEDNMLQSMARPFATLGVSGLAAAQDAYNLATGNKNAVSRTATGYNVPGLGQVMPAKIGQDIEVNNGHVSGGGFGKNTLKTIGTGLEIGSWYAPGTAGLAKTAVTQPLSIAGKQAAKKLALQRFTQGAAQAGGSELQKSGELTRALPSALLGGGFNMLAGKGFDKLGGALADRAAIKAANKVGSRVSEPVEKSLSSRIMNSIVKPGKKELTFGKNPGQAAVKYNITGSLDEMLNKSDQTLSEQINAIKEVANAPKYKNTTVDASGWEDIFDKRIKEAAENGDDTLFEALKKKKDQLKNEFSYEDGQMIVKGTKKTKGLTLSEAIDLKRKIGSTRKWNQADPDAKAVDRAIHDAYSYVDRQIDSAAPELQTINSDVSNLIGLNSALKNRISTVERQNMLGLGDKAVGGVGALLTGIATGGAAIPAMATGAAAAYASKAARSPQVMSRVATSLSRAPNVNRDQLVAEIIKALASPKGSGVLTKSIFKPGNK